MIEIIWVGKVVSVNKWHMVRHKKNNAGRTYAVIVKGHDYNQFINMLSWTIKTQCKERFSRIQLIIKSSVNNKMDHHNLLKPICDAIEHSGIIDNDRNIERIIIEAPERHNSQEPDKLTLLIDGDKIDE